MQSIKLFVMSALFVGCGLQAMEEPLSPKEAQRIATKVMLGKCKLDKLSKDKKSKVLQALARKSRKVRHKNVNKGQQRVLQATK